MRGLRNYLQFKGGRRFLWLVPLALGLTGCQWGKNNIPPTATQDPFLNSGPQGRPTSVVAPAPANRNEQTAAPANKDSTGAEANTTSRVKADAAPRKPATLMAPAETLSSSPANLAMQSASKSTVGVQQAQWQNPNAGGLEAAMQRLQQIGVLEQRLELRGGQWTFTCDVPHPTNPQQRRRLEATDASALMAVRNVLDRLETR